MNSKKGFTLIELLVVISIISLLSSIVLASLNTARAKARDAKRLADLHQIALALAFVYDSTGHYPTGDLSGTIGGAANCYTWEVSSQDHAFTPAGLLGTAMPNPPRDPTGTGCNGYWYRYFPPNYFSYRTSDPACLRGMYVLGIPSTMETVSGHMPSSPGPDSCIDPSWNLNTWNYVTQGYE